MPKAGHFLIFLSVVMSVLFSCSKQSGCIDPNAANYVYEAQKDDGSCLYDMSFYINSVKHGRVKIYINGFLRDSLNCAWTHGSKPRCGVDTAVAYGYRCTSNIPLVPGKYDVRAVADDGTIWESTHTLPENCLLVLISVDN